MTSIRYKCISAWKKCNSCQTILDEHDFNLHTSVHCPPDLKIEWSYGHIYEKKLFSFLKIFESRDKNEMFFNDVIQVSLTIAQLCDIPIGDPVLITAKNNRSIVKPLWPIKDNLLSSVFLTKQSLGELDCFEGPVEIKKVEKPPVPAKNIVLKLIKPESMSETQITEISFMLSANFNNKIILCGQYLVFSFYGQRPKFKIISIAAHRVSENSIDNITEHLKNIELDENENDTLYQILPNTKWEIKTSRSEENKKECCEKYCLSKLGGIDKIICDLKDKMYYVLASDFNTEQNVSCGIIIHGISGTGKTYLAKAMINLTKLPVVYIYSWQIFSKYFGEAENRIKQLFEEAIKKAPSIILIDELDSFCPSKSSSDQEKRVFYALLSMLDKLNNFKVVVIGITRQLDSIESALKKPRRFDYEIEIPVPDANARVEILKRLLMSYVHEVSDEIIIHLGQSASHGFVGSDLSLACVLANTQAANNTTINREINNEHGDYKCPVITEDNLIWAFTQVKPSAMREILIETPNVKWSDIGGQEELKQKFKQVLEWPREHPKALARLGLDPLRGILLFGPPGCSKTMIAKAVATESKLNFISIKGAELFSKWVGESEKAVREVFRKAKIVSPSVIFFDEIDAISSEREADNTSGSNVQERVLSQLLTELDGIEPLNNVTVIAATNRPDRIDSALLRPGRLDCKLYVPLPTFNTRMAILHLQFMKTPIDDDVDIETLTNLTEGYSGAEVIAVCHEAAMKALQENLSSEKVNRSHFEYALSIVQPRTPTKLLKIYDSFIKNE
ncbi:hypothetical protein PGB90_001026 [Kerria lacca]